MEARFLVRFAQVGCKTTIHREDTALQAHMWYRLHADNRKTVSGRRRLGACTLEWDWGSILGAQEPGSLGTSRPRGSAHRGSLGNRAAGLVEPDGASHADRAGYTRGASRVEPHRSLPPAGADRRRSMPIGRRDAVYRRTLVVADALAAIASLLITRELVGPGHPALRAIAAVPLIVVMSKLVGIYDRQELLVRKSTLDEAPALFELATLYALIVWLLNGFVISKSSDRRELLVEWATLFVMLLAAHVTARWLSRRLTRAERCLVIGDEASAERIKRKLAARPSLHATVVAFVPLQRLSRRARGTDMHSSGPGVGWEGSDLQALVSDTQADRIIVAPEMIDADDVLNLIRAATSLRLRVSVVPRVLEVVGSSVEFDDVEGLPLLCMRSVHLSRSSQLIKRALDVTVAVVVLVPLIPLLAIVALAIKVDSRGKVLFRQLRIGRDGAPFQMLKFRTMVLGAHERRHELQHLNEADGLFKIDNDPRITRVGALLRRTSLDELPQLWNVIRGDMSLVGPRPLVVEEDEQIRGWERRRLQLTPGITGHWQVLGSARIPLHEMVKIDYLYVTNWSLWNDVKILVRTIQYVAGRKGQ
jgi:exopolysaccharide biosynthesis polyprenyl glycosylphosphotransferase